MAQQMDYDSTKRRSVIATNLWARSMLQTLVSMEREPALIPLIQILGAKIKHVENCNQRWGLKSLTSKINILKYLTKTNHNENPNNKIPIRDSRNNNFIYVEGQMVFI